MLLYSEGWVCDWVVILFDSRGRCIDIYISKYRGPEGREGGAGDTKKGFNVTLWGGSILFNQIREVCDVI